MSREEEQRRQAQRDAVLRDLATQINLIVAGLQKPPALRKAKVVAIDAGPPPSLTIQLSGDDTVNIAGVAYDYSYVPSVNDIVTCVKQGNSLLVTGKHAPQQLTVAPETIEAEHHVKATSTGSARFATTGHHRHTSGVTNLGDMDHTHGNEISRGLVHQAKDGASTTFGTTPVQLWSVTKNTVANHYYAVSLRGLASISGAGGSGADADFNVLVDGVVKDGHTVHLGVNDLKLPANFTGIVQAVDGSTIFSIEVSRQDDVNGGTATMHAGHAFNVVHLGDGGANP
ncbi:hypothetical protein GCM10012275_28170 [Longimycelium tulufanense]|uniref:Uncharacterized protein n=1 Tax=Longimycelium tulufanense TaxID=907463 RepID=A0A8J3FUI7_9PSEU|nr:hypothetical protein [Longimycelium tulufanense]GGM55414.1 hypothetical protein GCM10012275_28170 [Longimycelium tulufanense]